MSKYDGHKNEMSSKYSKIDIRDIIISHQNTSNIIDLLNVPIVR